MARSPLNLLSNFHWKIPVSCFWSDKSVLGGKKSPDHSTFMFLLYDLMLRLHKRVVPNLGTQVSKNICSIALFHSLRLSFRGKSHKNKILNLNANKKRNGILAKINVDNCKCYSRIPIKSEKHVKKSWFFQMYRIVQHSQFVLATVTIFFPFLCWRNIIARHVALAAERGFALVGDGPSWIISSLCEEGQDHMARDRLNTHLTPPPRSIGLVRPRNLFNRHQAKRTGPFQSGAPRGGR